MILKSRNRRTEVFVAIEYIARIRDSEIDVVREWINARLDAIAIDGEINQAHESGAKRLRPTPRVVGR